MLLADVPQSLTDAGVIAGTITALIVFLGLLSRLRPVRWLWHQLVSEPLGNWLRHQILAVTGPLIEPIQVKVDENAVALEATTTRLAETTLDLSAHMADEMLLRRVDLENRMLRQQHVDQENEHLRVTMAGVEATVMDLHDRVDATLVRLAEGNPEVRPPGRHWDTIEPEPEDDPPEEGP